MASLFPIKAQSEPVQPSEIAQIRNKIDKSFKEFAELISAVRRPLPNQTGDGTYLPTKDDPPDVLQKINAGLKDLSSLGITDIATLLQVQEKQKTGALWDDKKYLMERLIQTAARFPDGSATGKKVTDGFLESLYNDLKHPPQSYLGKEYQYRSADGSNNSLVHPNVGKAGQPYARTVAPKQMQPGALPAPEDIFDSVMTRTHHEPHPNKISSMLFYLASIIIHDVFLTDRKDFSYSLTSSYLDLSPLYGKDLPDQLAMRTMKDGKIKADCFSESRLLNFPPGVGAILIMYNRFHNSVVDTLARINQNGQFTPPSTAYPSVKTDDPKFDPKWKTYDENLFQVGRLITCGLYINHILLDYVRTILNLNKTNYDWALDPRANIPSVPVGAGNQVSAEFNLVYRWHSAISDRDEKWTWDLWKSQFPELGDPETADWHDFVKAAAVKEDEANAMDPQDRPFGGFKRGPDGKFTDDDLVNLLCDSIEDVANSFGANRVPPVMRVVEILGMKQARAWNVASLNEFRVYFGLEPHKTFESINSDPYVAEQLKHLYDHPDYVELYPGLVTEESKIPMVPGAGLTPSYTVSRAVLSDAVALVRGDRFYTIDYHPKKLTNWGYSEAASDVTIDNGAVFYKLFLNAFPHHFKPNSVYIHYPLTIPSEMQKVLTNLERGPNYSYDRPKRLPSTKVISSYATVKAILTNTEAFKVSVSDSMAYLLGDSAKAYMVSEDGAKSAASRKMMEEAIYLDGKWESEVRQFYEVTTEKLLKEKSYKIAKKNQVDIIRDIGNLAHVHFAAEMWALPLKTTERPLGVFTEHEMYLIMAGMFTAVFFDPDPVNSYPLHQKTKKATKLLGDLVEANVTEIHAGGVFSRIIDAVFPHPSPLKDYGVNLIKRLLKSGMDVKQLVWGHILGTVGAMTANQGQLFAQTLEYYLTTGSEHLPAINALAKDDSDAAFEKLMRYVMEGARLAGESGVYRQSTKACEVTDGKRTVKLAAGDKILLNLFAASRDSAVFPNPDKVDLKRPLESYITLGIGSQQFLGDGVTRVALTAMFKVIGKLNKLRPTLGDQGKIYKVDAPYPEEGGQPVGPWYHNYLTESHDRLWPFPQSMKVNWD
ncbi:heme peroxidase [Microthyrium microscopicum]|uniref:Heme peroxidase n=1 Tax=Microthyrium microscopicum TaxID=703497 RepID=A0A6A6UB74_9PEZI|nr:heme peroxidase [Microthyrium microscopicum]